MEEVQFRLPVAMDNKVIWKSCGDWNGSYHFSDGHIELCNENLLEGLEVARMILLHELGHAYTFRYHTDLSRWQGNYEDAADEFAAVMTAVQGRPEDMIAKARLWEEWEKGHPWKGNDVHSPHLERAKRFRTLYHGFMFPKSQEGEAWRGALAFWKQEMLRNDINGRN